MTRHEWNAQIMSAFWMVVTGTILPHCPEAMLRDIAAELKAKLETAQGAEWEVIDGILAAIWSRLPLGLGQHES